MIKRWVLQKLEDMGFVTDKSLYHTNISFDGLFIDTRVCCWGYIKMLRKCGYTCNIKKPTVLDLYLLVGSDT